jgi:hypothetical protein
MRKLNIFVSVLVAALVTVGCSKNGSTAMDNSGSTNSGITTEDKENSEGNNGHNQSEISMADFFLTDGSKAHYLGEGNEFAELDIEVTHPYENYVIIHENNGGSMVRHIYKIEKNSIGILEEMMIDYKEDFPTLDELNAMIPTGVYLQKPFEVGTTFDNWTIVQTDAIVETPYKKFENALVIEMKGKDFINRKYFVEGFGEVKREAVMTMDEGDYVVTSTLKAVDQ